MVPSSMVDMDGDLIEKLESLFADVNVLDVGEGSSKVDVQFVGPSAKINNWEATLLPTRKDSFYADFNDMTYMRNLRPSLKSQSNSKIVIQEIECDDELKYDEDETFDEIIEEELDGEPWFHDIREYIRMRVYPVQATGDQKRTIRWLASGFFFSGGILYKKTPDLGLLRCIDARQATTIMTEVHGDLIHSPPSELHTMSAPLPFVAWGMDVIGPIDPTAPNGHRFILVAIDYFTKWVEAKTFKAMTKKAMVDFVHSNIICQFGIPKMLPMSVLFKQIRRNFKAYYQLPKLHKAQGRQGIARGSMMKWGIKGQVEVPSVKRFSNFVGNTEGQTDGSEM
ncbi:uncharacterized protein [Nicotiana sylvestris]|uniref:uncharacterized protein n=1 Tax=Nicotiana sylvestris TaxID=4096 RepID=UPI00388C61D1